VEDCRDRRLNPADPFVCRLDFVPTDPWSGFCYVFVMHGGARAGAGHPHRICDTRDTVLGRPQPSSGPSLSIPGVTGSSGNIHPLFRDSDNDGLVSPISDPSSGVQSDAMEDIVGSEHSPAASCEFRFFIYN
jgi:hypothetical protein